MSSHEWWLMSSYGAEVPVLSQTKRDLMAAPGDSLVPCIRQTAMPNIHAIKRSANNIAFREPTDTRIYTRFGARSVVMFAPFPNFNLARWGVPTRQATSVLLARSKTLR
jgi:hypothetical protein